MKTINLTFDEKDFKKINKVKKRYNVSWEKFLMMILPESIIEEKDTLRHKELRGDTRI